MKLPFKKFDSEKFKTGGEHKIGALEKTIIYALTKLGSALLIKIRKAKTYQELYDIHFFIEKKVGNIETKFEYITEKNIEEDDLFKIKDEVDSIVEDLETD